MPPASAWSSGIDPRPISVVATGMARRSASSRSRSEAPAHFTPLPARISGRSASKSSAAASSTAQASGLGALARRSEWAPPRSDRSDESTATGCASRSLGKSRWTGPGMPDLAAWNAVRISRLASLASMSWSFHLVTLPITPITSNSCHRLRLSRKVSRLADSASSGTASFCADQIPSTVLEMLGPTWNRQQPILPVTRE